MTSSLALTAQRSTTSLRQIMLCGLLMMLPLGILAQTSVEQPPATPSALQGSPVHGEDLFTGRTTFRNRGPACIACHSVAGLPFPGGGMLGPDLTQTYSKLGPEGTAAALQTLFFPTMSPIYKDHQLVPQEQADMVAFFKQAASESKPQSQAVTPTLILVALLLGIIFVGLTAFFWRKRVLSVRRALVARATGQGARS